MCVCLHVHQIEDRWAAKLMTADVPPPEPGTLMGLGFFGATAEEAEHAAKVYLGLSDPVN